MSNDRTSVIELASDIVVSYVRHNEIPAEDISPLIKLVHGALSAIVTGAEPQARPVPAVDIRKSITHNYLVCLEDGHRLKSLKRYLRATFDMSPDDYRAKWGLAADYPMVSPAYSQTRSQVAKKSGLGRFGRGGRHPKPNRTAGAKAT